MAQRLRIRAISLLWAHALVILTVIKPADPTPWRYDNFPIRPLPSESVIPSPRAASAAAGFCAQYNGRCPFCSLLAAYFASQDVELVFRSRLYALGDPLTLSLPLYRTRVHRGYAQIVMKMTQEYPALQGPLRDSTADVEAYTRELARIGRADLVAVIHEFLQRWKHFKKLYGVPAKVQIRSSVLLDANDYDNNEDNNDDDNNNNDESAENRDAASNQWTVLRFMIATVERLSVLPAEKLRESGFRDYFRAMVQETSGSEVIFEETANTNNFHKFKTREEKRVCEDWLEGSAGPDGGLRAKVAGDDFGAMRRRLTAWLRRWDYNEMDILCAVVTVAVSVADDAEDEDQGRKPVVGHSRHNSGVAGRRLQRRICVNFLQ